MDSTILEFLEAYKSLDELCKQILSSNQGVSEYISEMSNESQGYIKIAGWKKDLNDLKRVRWIRNTLVHEPNSFQDDLISIDDIEWVKDFRSRIMESTDPFSLLYQLKNKSTQGNSLLNQSEEKTIQEDYYEHCFPEKENAFSQSLIPIIVIVVIFLAVLFSLIF